MGCGVVYDTMLNPWFGADPNSANPTQVIIDTNGVFVFVSGIGASDEVWYNAGDNHWYTGTSTSPYSPHPVASTSPPSSSTTDQGAAILGVIDGTSQLLDQIVPTINVPGVPPLLGPPPGAPLGELALGRRQCREQSCVRASSRQQRYSRLLDRMYWGVRPG